MKLLKRFSLLIIALALALAGVASAGTLPAKAQTRTMTLSRVGSQLVLTDSGASSGTLAVTEEAQDGTLKHTLSGSWNIVGSTGTFSVTFTAGHNTIQFLSGASVIGHFYADVWTANDYAAGPHDATFRPDDIDCGMTETHATAVTSLSGVSPGPYTGHITKITRLKADPNFACEFSVEIKLNSADTFTLSDLSDGYSTHIPGTVDLGLSANPLAYTCTRYTSKDVLCSGWLGPNDSWQLNAYYSNPTKPHGSTNNDIYVFTFYTGGNNSNYIYNWIAFSIS